jgi:hypothetical protein
VSTRLVLWKKIHALFIKTQHHFNFGFLASPARAPTTPPV